ncbi:MAG: FAD-dependent monooxygenase [Candidatus Eisenbacteria bacterium]|nr:FAD-dependent monooxygenase [Candidatus Eisenbacteria bacterium]
MFGKHRIDVGIVGGGPVGLFSALLLRERGLEVEVFDENWRTAAHSYALALHPQSLTLLDEVGLASELIPQGRKITQVALYDGERREHVVKLDRAGGRYPFVLVLPQSAFETALEERLEARKVKVHWNHRVHEIRPAADSVTLLLARLQKETRGYPIAHTEWVVGKEYPLQCSFVIGADGYNSFTRRSLDLGYADLGGRLLLSVFEFETPAELPDEVRVVLNPENTNVLWPMADGRCRWSFQLAADHADALTLRRLHSLLETRAPWFKPLPDELHWSSVVQFEHRLAERFGKGRVWLAGDAAHLTDPVGAQSMNAGLIEAHTLARSLFEVARDGASDDILDDYGIDRSREWKRLLGLGATLPASESATPWVNERRHRILASLPATGGELDGLLGQLGLKLAG